MQAVDFDEFTNTTRLGLISSLKVNDNTHGLNIRVYSQDNVRKLLSENKISKYWAVVIWTTTV